jgi:hypothetical protein
MNGRTETSAELGRWDRVKELPPKFSERAPDESWQVPRRWAIASGIIAPNRLSNIDTSFGQAIKSSG